MTLADVYVLTCIFILIALLAINGSFWVLR